MIVKINFSRLLLLSPLIGVSFFSPSSALCQSNEVEIKNLRNVNMGSWKNLSSIQSTQDFCVAVSTTASNYLVTAHGEGEDGRFFLRAGNEKLPIELQWRGSKGAFDKLSPNVPKKFALGSSTSGKCATNNAHLKVVLNEVELAAVTPADYQGDIRFVVEPE